MNINTQGDNGTALHGAAVEGDLAVIEFLLARGADVNAINPYGDSPLANAMTATNNAAETQALLTKHGGTLIKGSEEQRSRVIREQARRQIEELNQR